MLSIIKPTEDYHPLWKELRGELYPEFSVELLDREFEELKGNKGYEAFIAFLNDVPVGLIEVQVRENVLYALYPGLYIESIYVRPNFRKQGVAKYMFSEMKKLALSKGLKAIGSDAYITNETSITMHKALGFEEISRTVNFVMEIS